MEIGDAAGFDVLLVVRPDSGAQRGAPGAHHLRHGAVRIVPADAVCSHQRRHDTAAGPRRMRAGNAADGAAVGQMHEAEIGGGRNGLTGDALDRPACRIDGGRGERMGGRNDAVHGKRREPHDGDPL